MGIFDWLKRKKDTKEEKQVEVERVFNISEIQKAYPDQEEPVELVDEQQRNSYKQLNKQLQSVESDDKHQPPFVESKKPKNTVAAEQSTNIAIQQWEDTIKAAQQHPLSQVKIINSQILEELNVVLKNMNARLDKLDDLDKLDIILELLEQTKTDLESKGVRSASLDNAISKINQLTLKDKDVIEWIGRQERVTAQQLADFLNLSRSTASFRLNRLAELGAVEKEAIGKKIYYKLKKGD